MARHVYSNFSVVFVVFLFALVALGLSDRVLALEECIEQPGREAAQGSHWHYHYDRGKNRKCWHLDAAAPAMRDSAPLPKDQSDAVAPPPVTSVGPWPFGGRSAGPLTVIPQGTTTGEPRIIQSDPTKPLTIDDIAQRRPDIPEEFPEPRYVTPLSPAQRRALFEEYLKWEEVQRNLGAAGAPGRSP